MRLSSDRRGLGLIRLALSIAAWSCGDSVTNPANPEGDDRNMGCASGRRGCGEVHPSALPARRSAAPGEAGLGTAMDDAAAAAPSAGERMDSAAMAEDASPSADGGPSDAGLTGLILPKKPTPPALLVAFLGDQGVSAAAQAVLELVASEGADLVLHNGDFDYRDDPEDWENRIDAALGAGFPYLATVGNHDAFAWVGPDGYQAHIARRAALNPDIRCEGDIGVMATCEFRGLRIVQSCVGVTELDPVHCAADAPAQLDFLANALSRRDHVWTVCSWHKNQHDFQIGTKTDEVGYGAYRLCMERGAMVSTGHEHSYARTTTLTDIGNRFSGHGAYATRDVVEVALGKTFAFVSGISGRSIRPYDHSHDADTWWGAYATSDVWKSHGVVQNDVADFGAMFIRFYVDGQPDKAHAYFKDIGGRVLDEFDIYTR